MSPTIPSENNQCLNFQRERECKSFNLEKIRRAISSSQKNETQSDCSYTENDSQDNQYETTICNAVIEYWKNLNKTKKFLVFHQKLTSFFGNTFLSDENFFGSACQKNLNNNPLYSSIIQPSGRVLDWWSKEKDRV